MPLLSEAATKGIIKNVFLKISQNSEAWGLQLYYRRGSSTDVF